MNMGKHKSIEKYVEAKTFIDYCKANNVRASISILDAYDRQGLLQPIYRIVFPDAYVRESYFWNEDSDDATIDARWSDLLELLSSLAIGMPGSETFQRALTFGHPLDVAFHAGNSYLFKPRVQDYKPWDQYKVEVNDGPDITIKEDSADHFYAAWQIFVLEELNYMHTIEHNYIADIQTGTGVFDKKCFPSKISDFAGYFQTLSNYKMLRNMILLDISFGIEGRFISGERLASLRKREKIAATNEYIRHPHNEWIRFIRKLVSMHVEYKGKEKLNLLSELERFLSSVIIMVRKATNMSFDEISGEHDGLLVGKAPGTPGEKDGVDIYPGELRLIFPDSQKKERKRAAWTLNSFIDSFNKILPSNVQIAPDLTHKIINRISEAGHECLFSHLYLIEELWQEKSPHWRNSIWAHIRSLAASIESLGREWFNATSFNAVLETAFSDYKQLRRRYNSNVGPNTKITQASSPEEFIAKLDIILKESDKDFDGLCGNYLLVTHLTRNYLSHKVLITPDLYGERFIEIYRGLIYTLISLYFAISSKGN